MYSYRSGGLFKIHSQAVDVTRSQLGDKWIYDVTASPICFCSGWRPINQSRRLCFRIWTSIVFWRLQAFIATNNVVLVEPICLLIAMIIPMSGTLGNLPKVPGAMHVVLSRVLESNEFWPRIWIQVFAEGISLEKIAVPAKLHTTKPDLDHWKELWEHGYYRIGSLLL